VPSKIYRLEDASAVEWKIGRYNKSKDIDPVILEKVEWIIKTSA
jgi:hypothetical protein